ncbi:uncharacterized protein LOC111051686 isoform X2 [Nilaparvata lugens]|uniref:uncharacterized protein LOC111051686 isoform X2 n=1 Tax=Nilaparvata lugens TaxID=108931 RepID=UPI00193E26DB|nr:uncharacterized protein LOC111051686 isoform X2 [Nilaparvata lugens]
MSVLLGAHSLLQKGNIPSLEECKVAIPPKTTLVFTSVCTWRRELDILKEAEQSPSQDRPNYREEESSTSSDEETFFTNILKKIVKHGKHKMYLSDSKESNLSNEMESDNDDDNDDSAKPPKLSPLLKTHCTPTQYCPQHFPSPLPSSRLPSLRKTRNQQLRKPKNPQNH